MAARVFKVLSHSLWANLQDEELFNGSTDDLRDGFIHLSTLDQLRTTIARHFAAEAELIILEFSATKLGNALRWEPSRDGALFPHLYAPLELPQAQACHKVSLGSDDEHTLPEELQRC